jgi:hypothetical protein
VGIWGEPDEFLGDALPGGGLGERAPGDDEGEGTCRNGDEDFAGPPHGRQPRLTVQHSVGNQPEGGDKQQREHRLDKNRDEHHVRRPVEGVDHGQHEAGAREHERQRHVPPDERRRNGGNRHRQHGQHERRLVGT